MSATKSTSMEAPVKRELVITRVFNAPRERVWKAWTDPEQAKRWWGPEHFTAPYVKIDLRVGGTYLNCMRSPEGKDFWSTGTYREIVPQQRLVMTDSFSDQKGNIVPASNYEMGDDWPSALLVTVTFEPQGSNTKFTLRHEGIPSSMIDLCKDGWNTSLDKLAASLRG